MGSFTEKKKAIFSSTLRLVVENGFHGCPMSQVAKSAEVGAGTIYHHFESKEQLIRELYEYITEGMMQLMFENDDAEQPFRERFFNFWMNLYRYYTQNPDVLKFYPQFIHSPYNLYRNKPGHDRFHSGLFDFFREGVDKGSLEAMNPEILGILVHNNIMTSARIQGYGKISLKAEEINKIMEMLWTGISAKLS